MIGRALLSIREPTVWDVLTLRGGYNTSVVLVGTLLLGIAAGLVGVFAMLRRRSLVADAVGHATLPGLCVAFLIAGAMGANGRSLAVLLPGAAVGAVAGLFAIQWIVRATRLTEDAAIGAVLSVWFGVGVVLLSAIQGMDAGNQGGLKSFIFGQTAAMSVEDARLMGGVAIASIAAVLLMFTQFRLVAFNDDYAAAIGVRVGVVDGALMALVVLVSVVGLQAVGMLLVVAMLIIPAVAARFWTDRLGVMSILAAGIGGGSAYVGAALSARIDLMPAGPTIVLVAGCAFLVGMLCAPKRGVVAGMLRQLRVRVRVQADHAMARMLPAGPHAAEATLAPGLIGVLAGLSLRRKGLMRREGGMIALTEAGIAAAELANRRRRLWQHYLVKHADIAPSHVDISADAIEHVVDPAIVAQLEAEIAAEDLVESEGGRGA